MSQSNFNHIAEEYPQLANIGQLAERNAITDPSTSLSKLRLLVEKLTGFIIEFEQEDDLAALTQNERLKQLDYKEIIPFDVLGLFHKVRMSGNKASHTGEGSTSESKFMLKQTLKIIKWFYSVYEDEANSSSSKLSPSVELLNQVVGKGNPVTKEILDKVFGPEITLMEVVNEEKKGMSFHRNKVIELQESSYLKNNNLDSYPHIQNDHELELSLSAFLSRKLKKFSFEFQKESKSSTKTSINLLNNLFEGDYKAEKSNVAKYQFKVDFFDSQDKSIKENK